MGIDLGLNQEQLEKEARPPLIPDGTYEFMVDHIDEFHLNPDGTPTNDGRPRWVWWLKIINRPDLNRMARYSTPLTWRDPNGDLITSGIGFLHDILVGTGVRLQGTSLAQKETYYGRTGVMSVGHKPRAKADPNDPNEEEVIDNTVRIVVKRRGGVS
jgi:hypothetical protein